MGTGGGDKIMHFRHISTKIQLKNLNNISIRVGGVPLGYALVKNCVELSVV